MANKKQSITEGALILTLAVAIVKIVGLIYKFPLISELAGGGWGYYQTAYNVYGAIYAVAVAGFPSAVARLVAGYSASGRYRDVLALRRESLRLFAVIGIIGSVGLVLLARPLVDTMQNPNAYFCVLAVAPSLFFSCLMSAYRGYYQGLSDMVPTAVSQVVEVLVKASFGYASVVLINHFLAEEYDKYGTVLGIAQSADTETSAILAVSSAGAIFAVTLSTLAGYLSMLVIYRRRGNGFTAEMVAASPAPERGELLRRQVLRYGFPLALSSIALRVTGLVDNATVLRRLAHVVQTDLAALYASHGDLFSRIEVAVADLPNYLYEVYGYGMPLFDLVPTLTATLGTSALPHIASAMQRGDSPLVKRNIESCMGTTMLIAAPIGFGITFMAKPLLDLLYPALPVGVQLASPMLSVLGVASVFSCLTSCVNTMLNAVGRFRTPVKIMAVGCVIKVVVNYIFVAIPALNIKAAPLGNLLCYTTTGIIGLILLMKSAAVELDFNRTMLKPMLAGALSAAVARLIYNLAETLIPDRVATIFAIGAAICLYLALVLLLGMISREELLTMPGGRKICALLEKLHLLR